MEFQNSYKSLKDYIYFEPNFVTWYCSECKSLNFTIKSTECYSGGRYCAPDQGI